MVQHNAQLLKYMLRTVRSFFHPFIGEEGGVSPLEKVSQQIITLLRNETREWVTKIFKSSTLLNLQCLIKALHLISS